MSRTITGCLLCKSLMKDLKLVFYYRAIELARSAINLHIPRLIAEMFFVYGNAFEYLQRLF